MQVLKKLIKLCYFEVKYSWRLSVFVRLQKYFRNCGRCYIFAIYSDKTLISKLHFKIRFKIPQANFLPHLTKISVKKKLRWRHRFKMIPNLPIIPFSIFDTLPATFNSRESQTWPLLTRSRVVTSQLSGSQEDWSWIIFRWCLLGVFMEGDMRKHSRKFNIMHILPHRQQYLECKYAWEAQWPILSHWILR